MSAMLKNVDPKTVEFRVRAARSMRLLPQVPEPELPKATSHRPTLLSSSIVVLAICIASLIWIVVEGAVGDDVPLAVTVLVLHVALFAGLGIYASAARDYRDRVNLAVIDTIVSEVKSENALAKQAMLSAITEVRTQVALVRAEMLAQLDGMPGRFEAYADQKLCDYRADEAIAPRDSDRYPPPTLAVVTQIPRAT